jgi:GTP-binding protein Era
MTPTFAIEQAPPGFRSGFVGFIGRPNVGKSTLLNYLVGQKIAITSPVAQTTRNRLRGILTTAEAQFILVDTPGIHKPHHELGHILVKNAQSTIRSVDVILFMVDGSQPMGRGDAYIADLIASSQVPIVLGLNKVDLPIQRAVTDKDAIQKSYQDLRHRCHGRDMLQFSALTGQGTEQLLTCLQQYLEPGPYYYPPELVTDQPERFIMGELIREQVLLNTREEVPHSVAVAIDRVEEDPTITRILATIFVERDSQKGILIGKKAHMLKAIGSEARQQMQKLIDGKIYLELFVKVSPKWRQSRLHLRELGYRIEDT